MVSILPLNSYDIPQRDDPILEQSGNFLFNKLII